MKKTIITVVGEDTVGIIAKVCTYLADNSINILDISQTIVQGYFNMMMITDMEQTTKQFGDIADEKKLVLLLNVSVKIFLKVCREFKRKYRQAAFLNNKSKVRKGYYYVKYI